MSRGRRTDSTAKAIWQRARELGAVVVEVPTTRLRQYAGQPDGFVWHDNLGIWLACELKGPTTRIRPEQAALAQRARINVLRTPDEMNALLGF